MKRIVINDPVKEIALSMVKDRSIIGIICNESTLKGYVLLLPDGRYIICYFGETDLFKQDTYETLEEVLNQKFVNESFVFDNTKELTDWLQR